LHTDGHYYFTATVPEYDRIEIRRTRDLNALSRAQTKVIWRKHESGEMSHHIWAPEIHHIDGRWYIYFTASRADAIWEIRPYVLMNESQDPFEGTWQELGRLETGWESFSLDGTTFVHRGRRYFAWTQRGRTAEQGGKNEGKGTNIYLSEMSSPTRLTGRVALLSKPEYEWETRERHQSQLLRGSAHRRCGRRPAGSEIMDEIAATGVPDQREERHLRTGAQQLHDHARSPDGSVRLSRAGLQGDPGQRAAGSQPRDPGPGSRMECGRHAALW
jgi:hypothetical protein